MTLEHARWRHFTWAVAALAIGVALIVKLGVVGQILGVVALLMAARSGYLFARTILRPAGTIRVDRTTVVLPAGLCRSEDHSFPTSAIRHVYFLRRAVPWTQTAPLLIIETGDRAFTYPREWFTSEADQRRIAQTLQHHMTQSESQRDAFPVVDA